MNPEADAANQRGRDRRAKHCVHFNGVQNGKCKAGISYDSFASRRSIPCLPAFRDDDEKQNCEKYQAVGIARVVEEEKEHAILFGRVNAARAAIIRHADNKRGVSGKLSCPVCFKGDLQYSISGYNGHVHAKCETVGCVSWME